MTNKNKRRFFILLLILVLVIAFLYFVANDTALGKIIGKIVNEMFIDFEPLSPENSNHELSRVDWESLKKFLFLSAVIFVLLTGLISYLISKHLLKKEREDISLFIANSLYADLDNLNDEYSDIHNELEKIKFTNLKNEESLLRETQRTKDLVTFLAHDLRTPLASVIGYLNLLVDTDEAPKEVRLKYLKITLDKAYRLDYLIDDFFDITRFNFHHVVLENTPFDLNLLFQQMVEEFYPILKKKNQKVRLDLPEVLIIEADSAKLARTFNNLLKNASSYGYENSLIEVKATVSEDKIRIVIYNEGKTIPSEKLNSIFDKFYRLDNARTTSNGGAGLGLAIAKEIVQAHGGVITANSEDNITTFTVDLPLVPLKELE